jgi:glycogen(starch) synthase
VRVLTVGNMYPPHSLGGYEILWRDSVEHLRGRGHEVEVLTTAFRLRDAAAQRDPTWVHRDLGWYWHDHGFPDMTAKQRLRLERRNARVLTHRLLRLRPDVVAWWPMGGMSLSMIEHVRRQGIPAVGVVADDWMLYGPQRDKWMGSFLGGRANRLAGLAGPLSRIPTTLDLPSAARWLFISEQLRGTALRAWPLNDTAVLHPGVDLELFTPAEPRPWAWRMAYVGRIDARKGIDRAVRALRELPEASLVVDGRGDDAHLADLRHLASELGVNERVRFQVSERAELPGVYAEADVVLFPVTWDEPWGLVPLEAMAVGRPVVLSGTGGQAEYAAAGENCLVSPPGEGVEGIVERVRRLAGDEALRATLRDGGLRTARAISAVAFEEGVERELAAAAA